MIKHVTRDYWTGAPAEVYRGGIVLKLSLLAAGQASLSDARAFALLKVGAEDTHVVMTHWQHGVAPRCRKPALHEVERVCETLDEARRVLARVGVTEDGS